MNIYKLQEDEQLLFGPARKALESNLSLQSNENKEEVTHTLYRSVCITTHHIVVESGNACITVPNADIITMRIQRVAQDKGVLGRFNILQAISKNGRKIEINILGIDPTKEALLQETFPKARIGETKGLARWLERLLGD